MIKSEAIDNRIECEYPFIGESDSNIILFTGYGEGIVIARKPGSIYEVGHYSKDWSTSGFTAYRGKVILSNDL